MTRHRAYAGSRRPWLAIGGGRAHLDQVSNGCSSGRTRAALEDSTSMVNLGWLPPIIAQAPQRLADALNLSDFSGNLTELAKGSTVWLAVTGLSRSGKTVLITSLIHNFLSALHSPNRMPLLSVVSDGRLIAARLAAAKAEP